MSIKLKKERIDYLDLIKGISIVLVVFCHYPALQKNSVVGNIFMLLAWAAVPNFFMVTGGVLHNTNKVFSWKKHLKKIFRIYGTIVIWKLIYLIFFVTVEHTIVLSKWKIINYLFFMGSIDGVQAGILWFMYAYLMLLLFLPITQQLFKEGKSGEYILLFIIAVTFCGSMGVKAVEVVGNILSGSGVQNNYLYDLKQVFPYGQYMNIIFYFLVGALLLKRRKQICGILNKSIFFKMIPEILLGIGIAGLFFVKWVETGTVYWAGIYLQDGYNRFFTAVMSIGFYLMFMNMNVKKIGQIIAKYIGKETMGIYFIHFPMVYYFAVKTNHFLLPYYSVGFNWLRTVGVVAFCTLIVQIIKKIPLLKRII